MAYQLTPEDVASVTDVECAFSTDRLLPSREDIPEDFWRGNDYTKLVSALFFGSELPSFEMELQEGVEPEALNRCVSAHLQSFGPKHA